MSLKHLRREARNLADPKKTKLLQGFFKTGKGDYGEGDIFLGLTVPESRIIAKRYKDLPLSAIKELLSSEIHEERLIALLILVNNYQKNPQKRKGIFKFYLLNTKNINNWDLVDLSSHKIAGHFLFDKDKSILYRLTRSDSLWERRIAVISTAYFIKNNKFSDTLKIASILLNDKQDLIHKAVGWMLREVGKKNLPVLENFLEKNYKSMPRTMLRYAIEKFPEEKRKAYLKGEI